MNGVGACPVTSLEGDVTPVPLADAAPKSLPLSAGALPPPPPPPLPPSLTSSSGKAPPFGVPPPPPPPPLQTLPGAQCSPPPQVLPYGLKPKKEFKPEVTMKRLNWLKVNKWKAYFAKF